MVRVRWVAAAVLLLSAHEVRADSRTDALARQATALYKAGDFDGAAAALLEDFELSPDPRLLFNIARAYEKGGKLAEAARFYHRYLDATSETEPALIQRAHEAIDRLEPKPPPVVPAPTAPPPPIVPPSAVLAPPPPPTVTPPPAAPAEPPPRVSHTVPYVVAGSGLAVVLAGLGVALWANATAMQMHDTLDPVEKPQLRSDAITRATAADITMGVGAALVITGVVLRFTSHPASPAVRVGLAGPSFALGLSWVSP